jgi:hypothetical protein
MDQRIQRGMYKQVNKFKEDANKLTELKENSSKQMNEIKKIMHNIKEEFSKDTKILKKL